MIEHPVLGWNKDNEAFSQKAKNKFNFSGLKKSQPSTFLIKNYNNVCFAYLKKKV
jgi:hypothetical protein